MNKYIFIMGFGIVISDHAFTVNSLYLLILFGSSKKKKKPSYCSICDEEMDNETTLNAHLTSYHSWKLKCEHCKKVFGDEIEFLKHCEDHTIQQMRSKNRRSRFTCPTCNAKFPTAALLDQHSNLHSGSKPFSCDQCDRSYPLKLSLAKHKAIKHNPNYKPPVRMPSKQCEECGKQFAYTHSLKTHMKTHSGEKSFKCNHCGRRLTTRQTLFEHVNAIHMGIKPFSCEVCSKSFVTEKILRLHKKIHSESKPHVCSMCGKGFAQSTAMLFHMRYHLGHKPFSCTHCHKKFVSSSLMKRHVRLSHETREELECADCGLKFTSRQRLRVHTRDHLPHLYTCDSCGRTFDSRSKYNRHVRGHNKAILACGDCDKVLSSRSSLKRHHKVHLAEPASNVEYIVSYHTGEALP